MMGQVVMLPKESKDKTTKHIKIKWKNIRDKVEWEEYRNNTPHFSDGEAIIRLVRNHQMAEFHEFDEERVMNMYMVNGLIDHFDVAEKHKTRILDVIKPYLIPPISEDLADELVEYILEFRRKRKEKMQSNEV